MGNTVRSRSNWKLVGFPNSHETEIVKNNLEIYHSLKCRADLQVWRAREDVPKSNNYPNNVATSNRLDAPMPNANPLKTIATLAAPPRPSGP
jgi:hypothetical protein